MGFQSDEEKAPSWLLMVQAELTSKNSPKSTVQTEVT